MAETSIEIAPLERSGEFFGFMILGRWPKDTIEWTQMLLRAVQLAAVPGLVAASSVFCIDEQRPDDPALHAVGRATKAGCLLGDPGVRPGQFADPLPPALVVLHPPGSTTSTVPEYEVASGCILLPGIPHLGLDHRAAWISAAVDGTVTELRTRVALDPYEDADTAALAMLLAA